MSVDTATGPFCTALGCRRDASHVIQTDDGEERLVCRQCASGEEVVGHV